MQTNKPVLILMAGLPGSGKSTLALAVGRRLNWPVIDKDTVKSGLLDLGAEEELAAQASYVLLHEFARDLVVGQGLSVVLDTPSSYERVIETCARSPRRGTAHFASSCARRASRHGPSACARGIAVRPTSRRSTPRLRP